MTQASALSRRRRLAVDETERRMLDAAIESVNASGLTVSLDHISFEAVIRDADVSRSAAYRRWPHKDLFLSDLVKELATAATPAAVSHDASLEFVADVIRGRLDRLDTPEQRDALAVELLRQGAMHDFQVMYASTEWRTYLALHATFLSLADGQLRDEVQGALAVAERGFTERIAHSWERVTALLGYRLRPGSGVGFDTLACLCTAGARGLVIMALSTPELATRRIEAGPFGTSGTAHWSLAALSTAAVAFAFLEPDPTVEWDEARRATARQLLASGHWPGDGPGNPSAPPSVS